MTKIIVCMVISLMSLLLAIGSFLTNDIGRYRSWIQTNKPKIMDSFDRNGHRYKKDHHRDDDRRPGMKAPPMDTKEKNRPALPQQASDTGQGAAAQTQEDSNTPSSAPSEDKK